VTRHWPRHIIPERPPRPEPAAEQTAIPVPPATCTTCGGPLTNRGYCLACSPALCGGCGKTKCAVCGGPLPGRRGAEP
jgi:hypothetical protein